MQEAVEVLDFELAAQIRDMMLEVKALGQRRRKINGSYYQADGNS